MLINTTSSKGEFGCAPSHSPSWWVAVPVLFSNLHIRHDGIALYMCSVFASFVSTLCRNRSNETVVGSNTFVDELQWIRLRWHNMSNIAREIALFLFFDGTYSVRALGHRLTIMCIYESLEKCGPRNAGLSVLLHFLFVHLFPFMAVINHPNHAIVSGERSFASLRFVASDFCVRKGENRKSLVCLKKVFASNTAKLFQMLIFFVCSPSTEMRKCLLNVKIKFRFICSSQHRVSRAYAWLRIGSTMSSSTFNDIFWLFS